MDVGIYLRISSETEDSIDTQRALIEKFCAREGHSIVAEYEDFDVKGKYPIAERPSGRRLIEDARAHKFQAIVAKQQDRLGRNAGDTISLLHRMRKLGISLLFVQETYADTPAGRLSFSVIAAMSQFYAEDVGQKVRDHNRRRAELGEYPGGPAPWGFIYDHESKILQADPSHAANVLTMFRVFVESGGNRQATVRELARQGIWGQKAGFWSNTRIARVIGNSIYRGLKAYDGNEYQIDVPEIVPRELAEQAYALLRSTAGTRFPSSGGTTYSGLLWCALCGSKFVCHHNRHGIATYLCDGVQKYCICQVPQVNSSRLDRLIVPELARAVRSIAGGVLSIETPKPLKRKLVDNSERKELLLSAYLDKLIDRALYEKKLAELSAEENRREETPAVIDPALLQAMTIDIEAYWPQMPSHERRTLIRAMFPKIVLATGRELKALLHSPLFDEPVDCVQSGYRTKNRPTTD